MTKAHAALQDVREVLIVVKETKYGKAVSHQDKRMLALINGADPSTEDDLREHREHVACLERVTKYFDARDIKIRIVSFTKMPRQIKQQLVVTVGGDGTFLTAAAHCFNTPIIGVRSTGFSLGHFALVNVDTFAAVFDQILEGTLAPHALMRIAVKLQRVVIEDGHVFHHDTHIRIPVLNDVFVMNNKSATARYTLEVGGVQEKQDSSGLWIGTPSGSTAALRSAGGKHIPITEHKLEYVTSQLQVRHDAAPKLFRGVVDGDQEITVVSRMPKGKLYLDGEFKEFAFRTGDRAVISRHPHDLQAFIDPKVNERYPYFFGIYTPW